MSEYKAGDEFQVDYPFWKDEQGEKGRVNGWVVGCFYEYGDYEVGLIDSYIYDTFGKMVLKVEGTCQIPGRAERIFYTRKWVDPDGKEFDNSNLHVTSCWAFTSLLKGRRHMKKAKVR